MENLFESAGEKFENKDMIDPEELLMDNAGEARIIVIGCGGAGNNTITRLHSLGIKGAELIAVNTDKQQLKYANADEKILIGYEITKGLGAGGYPDIGEQAAMEAKTVLKDIVEGADLTFVTCGLGGGTGTGSIPVVAEIARNAGSVVVGAVTMPFKIEGARIGKAKNALERLRKAADSVVVIDNNKLLEYYADVPINDSFKAADEVLARMVKGISETISIPSLINLDFADVRSVMQGGAGNGVAMIGLGQSDTRNRAEEAVTHALENPLLDVDYRGATGALVHITGGPDLTLSEANRIGEIATGYLRDDSQVIWGARIDPEFENKIQVMVVMTGISSPNILGPSTEIKVPRREIPVMTRSTALHQPSRLNTLEPKETIEKITADLDIDYII